MKLVDNWHQAYRMASVQLGAALTTLLALIGLFPDNAYEIWLALPPEVTGLIPEERRPLVGAAICLLAIFLRLKRQRSLQP